MANGLVPIVLELPENLEAVGDAGILVEPKHDALAAALRHLAADTDARTELGSRARQRVARVFDATVMTNRTRTLYDDVLAGTR